MKKIIFLVCFLLFPVFGYADVDSRISLYKDNVNIKDKASLQRGAKLFVNYCAGCHSLNYIRYSQIAKDIGITNDKGGVLDDLVKRDLIFTNSKITDTLRTAMTPESGKRWFGVSPPDLSLEARVRGANWIYSYLMTFYRDDSRPWGSNNLIFMDVAMPNVISALQGEQEPVYRNAIVNQDGLIKKVNIINSLKLTKPGLMSPQEYNQAVVDLVNFLAYVAEPGQLKRKHIGFWVLGFLFIFGIVCYMLKKEYWKDIH